MQNVKNNVRSYLQPAFVICVLVLAAAGAGTSITINELGIVFEKEPLPLKKSLDLLDEGDLRPYRVVPPKQEIKDQEILRSLGTRDYIQWVLEDTESEAGSPVNRCLLFITYYSLPDRVPHVPEECWTGGGYQELRSEAVTLSVSNGAGFKVKIPATYLVFGPRQADLWHSSARIPDVYFFRVNGRYAGNRREARLALNKNLFGRHSYFCKVEVVFNMSSVAPTKEEALAASERLLRVILPILEQEYWPNWKNGKVVR
jgi:hypothetical protein